VLNGFTVGITADRRWDEQAALFERRHACVVHAPTIRTLPLGAEDQIRDVTTRIIERPPEVFIANTGLGVRSWFGAADSWGLGAELLAALGASKIFARGPKASGAVHSLGLGIVARAPSERLAEAVDMAMEHIAPGATVAVQVDGSGTTTELERIASCGATVIAVPVYEWKLPADPAPTIKLARSTIAGRVQAVTFTTGPAVRNWLAIAAEHDLDVELLDALNSGNVVIGIVGPVCADVAERCGIRPERMTIPAAFRLGPLVRAVTDELLLQAIKLEIGTHAVTLSGSAVTVDDVALELTDIEARLFGALARAPGVVISKADLLNQVWGEGSTDEHGVEVAIARLRQRLGDLASSLVTVHRRGYALRP
jgi:uroporphyrinogen-III synthase